MSSGTREYLESSWTTIPSEYTTAENEDLQLTIKRDGSGVYIGNFDAIVSNMSQISDVAYRRPATRLSTGPRVP
jgi:hypothetical protein